MSPILVAELVTRDHAGDVVEHATVEPYLPDTVGRLIELFDADLGLAQRPTSGGLYRRLRDYGEVTSADVVAIIHPAFSPLVLARWGPDGWEVDS